MIRLNKNFLTTVKAPPSRPSDVATMIPPRIRDYFDIRPGDYLYWSVLGDVIVIKKMKAPKKESEKESKTK